MDCPLCYIFCCSVFPPTFCFALQDKRFKSDSLWKSLASLPMPIFAEDADFKGRRCAVSKHLSVFVPGFASVPVKGSCSPYSSLAWAFQTRCSLSAPWAGTVEQCRKSSFFNTCKSWARWKLLTVTNRRGEENTALERHSHENLCILTFLCLLGLQRQLQVLTEVCAQNQFIIF